MEEKKDARFVYRYKDSFLQQLARLKESEKVFSGLKNTPKKKDKLAFATDIKYTFEFGWKTMKDYLKLKDIVCLLPRKIITAMEKELDISNWLLLLDDLNGYVVSNSEEALDVLIKNYFSRYKKTFAQFCEFFDKKIAQKQPTIRHRRTFPHANHSVMDSFSFMLFTNYFLKKKKIDFVRIYGSRAGKDYRTSSDIDFLIGGNFTKDEFSVIEEELKALRHPYLLDCTNVNETDTEFKKHFVDLNLKHSIPFYDKKDFA